MPRKYFEIGRALQKTELAGQFSTKQLQVLYDEFQRHAEGAGASEGSFRVVSADARSTRRLTKVEFSRIFSRMGITDPDLVDANFRRALGCSRSRSGSTGFLMVSQQCSVGTS